MRTVRAWMPGALLVGVLACGVGGQQAPDRLVRSSDPELGELAAALLPDLAERSGLVLREPVRLEERSRDELILYLRTKLDQELPREEARATVDAYAFLGLVPPDLDLRAVLLALYTEQVAGFYEPDSTALFVMDDQPRALLQGLLVHELVHAIQDQSADLDALTDPELGNDRRVAAQAAIEGHATLVMLEFMTEQMTGAPVDLGGISDFASQMRPALESMRAQFPALARAPRVIQESLLFPYLEGAAFVQALWAEGERVAPFGPYLPKSTEQVVERDASDPIDLAIEVEGARTVHDDVLGRLELGVFLDEHLGDSRAAVAEGWDGDHYTLVERSDGSRGLVWYVLWEDVDSRDRFADGMVDALAGLGAGASLERLEAAGRPATLLRVGVLDGVSTEARATERP